MAVWYEDLAPGRIDRFGRYVVTREEMLDFASKYDPQPFHLSDEAAAKNPLFGRMSASGWHTAAMGMAMSVRHWEEIGFTTLGGAGIEKLDFLKPVFAGDVLHVENEVLEARLSKSRPGAGIVRHRTTIFNQDDTPVLSHVGTVLVPTRPA